jgi:hypothetical protein
VIRSDNGVPFASPNGLFNLSRLSVWWLRLGISIERIRPGHPQQNGRHERMHLTLNRSGGKFLLANAVQAIAAAEQGHGAERLTLRCVSNCAIASCFLRLNLAPWPAVGELPRSFAGSSGDSPREASVLSSNADRRD